MIKVEDPGCGDKARNHGPFPDDIPHAEKSGLFLSLNTGKKGITLNLSTDTGKDIFRKLIESSDVLVENNECGLMEDMGLDYKRLSSINPRLIMVSITPFGQSGPYNNYKAHHINACASGGEAVGIGHPDRKPLTMPLSLGGYQSGVCAATAILAALIGREKTQKGQYIDISEVEVWATLHVGTSALTYIYRGVTGIRRGIHAGYFRYPCTLLPCKDGYISMNAPQAEQWSRFLGLMGNPKWAENPRYRDRRAMEEQYPDEVDALLIPWLKQYTKQEILELCQKNRIPFAPVYNIGEVLDQPQLKQLDFFVDLEHPQAGRLKYTKGPCTFHKTDWQWESSAPLLGEHNEQIYTQLLGYSKQDLENMRRSGII